MRPFADSTGRAPFPRGQDRAFRRADEGRELADAVRLRLPAYRLPPSIRGCPARSGRAGLFLGHNTLFATNTARLRARPPWAISRHFQARWDEALTQAQSGPPPRLSLRTANSTDLSMSLVISPFWKASPNRPSFSVAMISAIRLRTPLLQPDPR